MSALVTLRSNAKTRPWLSACLALIAGFILGLLAPLSSFEKERFVPLAPSFAARLKAGLRAFADRSIVEGLGRR